ncbi:MAG: hypothetical protein EAX90_11385 [Candidatus Heimdallarchaeota archaeon]|nr:hypothetical protein [Candidatus Heimdallarchaeota archaeon]
MFLITIFFLQVYFSFENYTTINTDYQFSEKSVIPNYTTHSPIVIDSDNDFSSLGLTGDGSKGNPYIIENYDITSTGIGIEISGTTKYFIVRNCILNTDLTSISIGNVAANTAIIKNNVLTGLKGEGIYIENTNGVLIENNTIYDFDDGIHLYSSHYTIVKDNNLTSGPKSFFSSSDDGLLVYESQYLRLINNTISKFQIGMRVSQCNFFFIANNTCLNCTTGSGVIFFQSNYGSFINNTIAYCLNNHGISIDWSRNNIVSYNKIKSCWSYAIDVNSGSNFTKIHHNNIIDNALSIYVSQAVDNGESNIWSINNEGNYWSDLGSASEYSLLGIAENKDYHPLNSPASADWNFLSIPPFDDLYEINDDISQAKELQVNNIYSFISKNDDWYKIPLEHSYNIEIILSSDSEDANLDLFLVSLNYGIINSSSSLTNFENLIHLCTYNGYYFIKIDLVTGVYAEYTLEINYEKSQYTDDNFEDNDYFSQAATISTDSSNNLFYMDEDYFIIYLSKKLIYTFQITFDNTVIDLDLYLFNNWSYDSLDDCIEKSTSDSSVEEFTYIVEYEDEIVCYLLVTCNLTERVNLKPTSYTLTISNEKEKLPFPIYSSIILVMIIFGIFRKRKRK